MLDLKFLRENPEIVKQNIRNKFQDKKLPLVDEVIALDVESRNTKQEADNLRFERNTLSKQIGTLMGQGKKEEAEEVKKKVTADSDITLVSELKGDRKVFIRTCRRIYLYIKVVTERSNGKVRCCVRRTAE